MKYTNTDSVSTQPVSRKRKHGNRRYNPNKFAQKGELLNVTTTVPVRIQRLLKTEAAINNKSVSAILLDILEQRYRLVD